MQKYFQFKTMILSMATLLAATMPASAQRELRTWQALDGVSPEGTPVTMKVLEIGQKSTIYEVQVRGVWLTPQTEGSNTFTRIEFPPVELGGAGFGRTAWFDFPTIAKQVYIKQTRFQNAPAITIPKSVYPPSALGKNPRTAEEMLRLGIDPAGARPGIPTLRGMVAASRLNTVKDLGLNNSRAQGVTLKLAHPLAPAGYDAYDAPGITNGFTSPVLMDADFYKNFQGSYTGAEEPVTDVKRLGAYSGVEVRTPLVSLINASQLVLYTNLLVQVTHLQGTEDFDCPISWDNWIFNFPFLNGEALRDSLTAKGIAIEASRSAHYLILTPRKYRSALNEFALWKQSKGLNVDFAYVGSDPVLDDVAADRGAIDAYIENLFKINYCHGLYVLLVGDIDTIPSGRSNRISASPDYADADSDHVYAVIGDDLFSSVYVGRLPCKNEAELQTQLDKILSYERSPAPGNWPAKVTLAANSQNDDGTAYVSASFASKYAAAVNAIASYPAYTDPPTFQVLHAGAASYNVTRAVDQDVVDAINEGRGQVLYRGHGGSGGWVGGWDGNGDDFVGSTYIPQLNNDAYPIVYSIACQNSRLRSADCIARQWMLRDDGGAVAHWSASVNSYTSENHNRARGIFRAIYESGFTRLGPALAEAERISYVLTGGGDGWANNTFCYILLGDPEMTIRRDGIPYRLGDMTSTLLTRSDIAVVQVKDSAGALVPGAFVNIDLGNGVRTNGFTGPNGELELPGVKTNLVSRIELISDRLGFRPIRLNPISRGPKLVPVESATGEGFRFQFASTPGRQYLIQGSPDMSIWYDVKTTNATSKLVEYEDPGSARTLRLLPGQINIIGGTIIRSPITLRARNHYFQVIDEGPAPK